MIAEFLNQRVTLMQLVTVSGRRKALSTVQTAMSNIQNSETRESRITQGVSSKAFMAWFEVGTNIQEGMVIRNHLDNRRYKVLGVEHQGEGFGLETEHLEVTMVKYNL